MVAVLASCTAETFRHGAGETGFVGFSSATDSFGTSGDGGASNVDGNYPEPAVTRCGDVLGDRPPIDGLSSAWAVIAVPDATRGGTPVETGSMLLRISEGVVRDCGDGPDADGFAGSSSGFGGFSGTDDGPLVTARGLELMLTPAELGPGVHMVSELDAPGVVVYGDGASTEPSAGASIELLRVDDDCVIGVVRDFETETGEPFMEGGFVAQTCQRQCIPSNAHSC